MSQVAPIDDAPVYEVRAMSLAEILDTSFQLIKDAFVLLVGLASLVYVPLAVFMGVITLGMDFESMDEAQMEAALPMLGALLGSYVVIAFVGFPFVVGAITSIAGRLFLGRSMTFGDAAKMGLARFFPLLWTYLLYGLVFTGVMIVVGVAAAVVGIALNFVLPDTGSAVAVGAGFVAFLIGYVYAIPAMVLMPQVVVLEDLSGMDAVKRSWSLSHGVRWRVIGVLFTAGFLVFIPISGLQMMANVVPVAGTLLSGFAQAVGFAFTSAAQVVLYFDIRCRKEAFDLEHLAQMVEGEAPALHPGV